MGGAGTLVVVSLDRQLVERVVATSSPCSATVGSANYPAVRSRTFASAPPLRVVL
jgi:hypothetical protein